MKKSAEASSFQVSRDEEKKKKKGQDEGNLCGPSEEIRVGHLIGFHWFNPIGNKKRKKKKTLGFRKRFGH